MIVFGAIAPHGPIAVTEACTNEEARAREGDTERVRGAPARRCAAAAPDVVLAATPHSVHVEGAMAVVLASGMEGAVAGTDGRTIVLECEIDRKSSGRSPSTGQPPRPAWPPSA